ncbi:Nif3-like dinuclear metal center hexameric protein, partial [Achromobacter xylosoxidans]
MSKVDSHVLAAWLDDTLQAARFKDYCPNGLQVEGRSEVRHIITGVTASEALLRIAVERGADAVLVHHGWMWRNEDRRVIGTRRTRMALALKNDLNLYAYHLPLDAHPTLGNNAQLARVLGLEP